MRRVNLVPGLLVLVAAALIAAPAAQGATVAPNKYDFGAVPVGTTATVKLGVIASQVCVFGQTPIPENGHGIECTPETVAVAGAVNGPGFHAGPTSCGTAVFGTSHGVCNVTFTFTPTAVGPATGKGIAGTVLSPASSARQLAITLTGTGTPAAPGAKKKPCPASKKPAKKRAGTAAKKKPKRKPCGKKPARKK